MEVEDLAVALGCDLLEDDLDDRELARRVEVADEIVRDRGGSGAGSGCGGRGGLSFTRGGDELAEGRCF